MCEISTKEWTENMYFVVLGIVVEKYSGEKYSGTIYYYGT